MNNGERQARPGAFLADQTGAIVILVALLLPVFLGFTALAVDLGYIAVVKAQLNAAAEAGALSGAKGLDPFVNVSGKAQPNWTNGTLQAFNTVALNTADRQALSVTRAAAGSAVPPLSQTPPISQATPCYYRLTDGIARPTSITPTSNDAPAIQVTVGKTTGQNGGPLNLFFGGILGMPTLDLQAGAIAVISFPKTGGPGAVGTLFPLAVLKSSVDSYLTQDPPVSFKIGSGSTNGQWTSFKVNNQSASYITGLITKGNPTQLNLNDKIYIKTGVTATNYGDAASHVGQTVILPLVGGITSGQWPILGYIPFRIEATNQSSKYIQGHYDKDYLYTSGSGYVGTPGSGTYNVPYGPKLVN